MEIYICSVLLSITVSLHSESHSVPRCVGWYYSAGPEGALTYSSLLAIYALYPESFCVRNLAVRKVFAFSDSAGGGPHLFIIVGFAPVDIPLTADFYINSQNHFASCAILQKFLTQVFPKSVLLPSTMCLYMTETALTYSSLLALHHLTSR